MIMITIESEVTMAESFLMRLSVCLFDWIMGKVLGFVPMFYFTESSNEFIIELCLNHEEVGMRNRMLGLVLILAMVCCLCGCKFVYGFQVKEDGSVEMTSGILIEEEIMTSMLEESETDEKEILKEGYELVTIDGQKYYQYLMTETIDDLLSDNAESNETVITKDSFVIGGIEAYEEFEAISDQSVPDKELLNEDELSDMDNYITYEMYITFPSKIAITNGDLSKDKKTATWTMSFNNEVHGDKFYAFTEDYVDEEKPVIKGVKNNAAYDKAVKVKYDDNCGVIKSATIDGREFASGKKISTEGTHIVIVEDLFGNKSTVEFVIK